jgi:hypothetical protein
MEHVLMQLTEDQRDIIVKALRKEMAAYLADLIENANSIGVSVSAIETEEPDQNDEVKCCPDCERPNQFGELCLECERERDLASEGELAELIADAEEAAIRSRPVR